MVRIGYTICPEMTRDPNNVVLCREDCAQYGNNPKYVSEGHDGYCCKNVIQVES